MADKTDKVKRNVPGKWYVDHNCIGCGVCVEVASDNIEMDESQPEDDAQEADFEEAAEQCPVEAIGDDG